MTATPTSATRGARTKVFLVDDHALFRAGIRSEIADRVWICGEASTVTEAIAGIHEHLPQVVLLDVGLPDGGGRAVVEGCTDLEEVAFLALSASDEADDVIELIRAGARGYVTKTVSSQDLVDGIRRVASGDAVFSPKLAGFVLDAFAAIPVAEVDPELDQLTPRERDTLRQIARGYTYKEIGERLYISPKTVETHVSSVLRKLQLDNRHQLSRWAAERNFR